LLIQVVKPFKYAIDGVRVVEFSAGVQELDEAIAADAIAAGWAIDASAPKSKPVANKALRKAQEAK